MSTSGRRWERERERGFKVLFCFWRCLLLSPFIFWSEVPFSASLASTHAWAGGVVCDYLAGLNLLQIRLLGDCLGSWSLGWTAGAESLLEYNHSRRRNWSWPPRRLLHVILQHRHSFRVTSLLLKVTESQASSLPPPFPCRPMSLPVRAHSWKSHGHHQFWLRLETFLFRAADYGVARSSDVPLKRWSLASDLSYSLDFSRLLLVLFPAYGVL